MKLIWVIVILLGLLTAGIAIINIAHMEARDVGFQSSLHDLCKAQDMEEIRSLVDALVEQRIRIDNENRAGYRRIVLCGVATLVVGIAGIVFSIRKTKRPHNQATNADT